MKKITLLLMLFFGFNSILSAQCLTSVNGQYPLSTYAIPTCDGLTQNNVTTCGYASEYSVVTVTAGETYTFGSSFTTDIVTISSDGGISAEAYGTGSVTWVSTVSGDIQFYTHLDDGACGSESVCRIRYVICGTPPTCIAPTGLASSNLTTTSATVSWTTSATDPANGYEYYLSTTNTAPLSTDLATDGVVAGVTSANLTGLSAATDYYIWVRSVCSNSDSSAWSAVLKFTTLCDAVTDFTENFDAAVAFPTCWFRVGTGGNTNVQTSSSAPSQSNVLYLYGTSATSQGLVSMIPVSNAGDATHRLRFKARSNFTVGGKIEVGYLTNSTDATSFVGLQTFTTTSTSVYNSFTAYLGTSPGTNQVIAFRHTGVPSNSVLIDDVVWEANPSCVEPISPTASNITTTTATISWTAAAVLPANGYEYYLSTTNTTPLSSDIATGGVGAGITTANLTGLTSSSVYYFWVRSVCSSSDSSVWSLAGTFTTLCDATTVPYLQDFESTTVPALPICTSNENLGLGNNWVTSNNPGSGFTTNCLRYNYNFTNPANTWFYTQGITLTAGTSYDISYKYGNNSTSYIESMKVAYGTSPTSTDMLNNLADHPSVTGGALQQNLVTFTPTTSGVYYFGYNAYSASNQFYLFVDDIKVVLTPSCVEPAAPTSSNVTTTTATIAWTASSSAPANGYEYYVSTTNTAPTASTIATGGVLAGVTTANLTSLSSSSIYYFWVRSVCSSSDSSAWSTVNTFTTLCTAVAAPYTQDFESATVPALPICTSNQNVGTGNNWAVASNPGYGFTTNCLRYAYNSSNAANAWFYTQGVTLAAGTAYDITYQYGNNSTTYVESMKVSYGTSPVDTAMTNLLADHPSITGGSSSSTAQQNVVTFTPTVSGDYFFGFNVYSIADQYYLYVDNISITPNLSSNTFSNSNFTFYPNPVKDVLNVSNATTISKVQVVNLLGQEMISKAMNDTQGQVDMSQLAAGTYLVKLTSDNQIKTIKVIKE